METNCTVTTSKEIYIWSRSRLWHCWKPPREGVATPQIISFSSLPFLSSPFFLLQQDCKNSSSFCTVLQHTQGSLVEGRDLSPACSLPALHTSSIRTRLSRLVCVTPFNNATPNIHTLYFCLLGRHEGTTFPLLWTVLGISQLRTRPCPSSAHQLLLNIVILVALEVPRSRIDGRYWSIYTRNCFYFFLKNVGYPVCCSILCKTDLMLRFKIWKTVAVQPNKHFYGIWRWTES